MKDNNHKIKSILKQVMIFNDFYEEVIQSSIVKNQDSAVSKLEFKLLHTVFRHEKLMISEVSEILNISLPNCSRYVKTAIEDGYIQKQIEKLGGKENFIHIESGTTTMPGYTPGRYGFLFPQCFSEMKEKCLNLLALKKDILPVEFLPLRSNVEKSAGELKILPEKV